MSRSSYGQDPTPSTVKRRWRTPRPLFDAVDARYLFTLDAAAEDGRLVPSFITPEMDTLVVPWALYCPTNALGERWAFANFPWGNRCAGFPGTQAFTRRAINQRSTLTGSVLLLPTAPDTKWWRECFSAASDVRFLPRIRFEHPDTGAIGDSPPGCGMTLRRVFERDRHTCVYCGATGRTGALVADHYIPWSKGGPTTLDNLVTACVPCNTRKGAKMPSVSP